MLALAVALGAWLGRRGYVALHEFLPRVVKLDLPSLPGPIPTYYDHGANARAQRLQADLREMNSFFQEKLGAMGYKFQFVTLAGFHSLNAGMFELAQGYRDEGMAAFSHLQEREFAMEQSGFTAVRHQSVVGAGYFDAVQLAVTGGTASTTAMHGSTEEAQFQAALA